MEVGHLTLAWQYVAIIINYSLFLHITHHEPFLCHHLQEPVSSPSILHAHNNLSFTEPMLIILLMCEEDNTLSATTTRLVNTNCKRILTTCWNNYCNRCLSSGGVCYLALVPSCCASSSTEEQEIRKFPVPSASDGRHYCDANFYCVIGQLAMEEEEHCTCVNLPDGERLCDPVNCEQFPHNIYTVVSRKCMRPPPIFAASYLLQVIYYSKVRPPNKPKQ